MPKLRFPGFEGEWETSSLGELGTFTKGAPLSKADISDNGTPLILYGELYTTYDEVANSVVRKTDKSADLCQYSRIGDVIIPTSGETPEEIATATCVMLPNVIFAGDLNIFRSEKIDGRIISYIINHVVNWDISRIAQGKSIVHIKADELSKIHINYPDADEQNKLISFLGVLSERIEKQRQLVEALKLYKRGVIQRVFSKRITGTISSQKWETVSISNLFSNVIDKGHPEETVLTITQGCGTMPRNSIDRRISYDSSSVSSYKKVEENDFILHLRSFEGGLEISNHSGIVSPAYTILRNKKRIAHAFYYAYFRSYEFIENKLRIAVEGIRDGKSINMDTFWNILIPFPSFETQCFYAETFRQLDLLIADSEQMLFSCGKIKQYLLQQLFI